MIAHQVKQTVQCYENNHFFADYVLISTHSTHESAEIMVKNLLKTNKKNEIKIKVGVLGRTYTDKYELFSIFPLIIVDYPDKFTNDGINYSFNRKNNDSANIETIPFTIEDLKKAFEAGCEVYYDDNDGRSNMSKQVVEGSFETWYNGFTKTKHNESK